MRTCAIAYLPSQNDPRFPTAAFLQNLRENPPAGEILLFSDHPQPNTPYPVISMVQPFDRPELKQARIVKPGTNETVENRAATNNLVFLAAVRIVEKQGFTHFLYLEADLRVKNHASGKWDERLFKEFFSYPRHLLLAGSIVSYNPYNYTLKAALRFEQFLEESKQLGRKNPIPSYGWLSAADGKGFNTFANGAGGIYSVAGINLLLPERLNEPDTKVAKSIWAWDFHLGLRLFEKFKTDVYDIIAYLPSLYSGFGNVLNSEADRLRMLEDGMAAVHQIKSAK